MIAITLAKPPENVQIASANVVTWRMPNAVNIHGMVEKASEFFIRKATFFTIDMMLAKMPFIIAKILSLSAPLEDLFRK
jgi:hypothetical protein